MCRIMHGSENPDIASLIRATRCTPAEHGSPKSVRFNTTTPFANNVAKSELPFMFTRIASTTHHSAILLAAISIAAAAGVRQAQAQQGGPLFTEAQVERGRALYQKNCQDCHGTQLDNGEFGGAPLKGSYFRQHWGSGDVASLFGYVSALMPPDKPGQLSPQSYADLTAFLLSSNGYAAGGEELTADPDAQRRMSMKK